MRKIIFKISKLILRILFRVEVKGIENFKSSNSKSLVISNHQSYLDAALIACFVSNDLSFAINTHIAELWWVKPFLGLIKSFKLNPLEPMSTKSLIKHINAGNDSVIFPEGRLTVTGSLMKVYNGPALVADASDARIIPITLSGPEQSYFSVLQGVMKLSLFPKITIHIHAPVKLELDSDIKGRKRREILGNKLYDIMNQVNFKSLNLNQSLYQTLLDASQTHGSNKIIAIDPEKNSLSFRQLINSSIILGNKLAKKLSSETNIALLMPSSLASLTSFWAIQNLAKTPVMLNFSMGATALIKSAQIADIKHIISSHQFIKQASLTEVKNKLEAEGIKFIFLEDIKKKINFIDKVIAPLLSNTKAYKKSQADDTALVLFTSGSEASPKGVALSHKNLLANCYQLKSCFDYNPQDILLNALPLFHSFGLTGGMLLPLFCGIKTLYYPSPLHYRIIPELAYQNDVTLLYGTDSFLRSYAQHAHSYDFYKLRYAIAGAEKLKDETRKIWSEKLGVRVLEAYGATEASPGIASNTPLNNKVGTVGKLLPGIEYKLEEVKGIRDGKKLLIKGPNIMKGYLLEASRGEIVTTVNAWYDTGDIVVIDEEGFVTIAGRVKRFAKIAGEMISLTTVETTLSHKFDKANFAIINVSDEKKGEKLILYTDQEIDKSRIKETILKGGLSELSIPRKIIFLKQIPLLASGKINYKDLKTFYENSEYKAEL